MTGTDWSSRDGQSILNLKEKRNFSLSLKNYQSRLLTAESLIYSAQSERKVQYDQLKAIQLNNEHDDLHEESKRKGNEWNNGSPMKNRNWEKNDFS